jgi:S1-C subfamily serine protease
MTIPTPGGPGTDPDWDSPLWGRPDTVAARWPSAQADASPPPSVQPEPPRRPSRRILLGGAAVALFAVGLVGAMLVTGTLSHDSTTAAATLPRPGASSPALPTPLPSQPSLTPPSEGSGQQGTQGSPGLTQKQAEAVAAVSPGLVDVVSTIGYDGAQGAGTGLVVSADGLVLTNHHVVAGATSINVTDVGNGKTYTAKVLGYDRSHDVALLKLSGASGLQTAALGDSGTVAVGDPVVAVGNALGKGGAPTAVAGTVTDLNQSIAAQDSANGTAQQLSGLIQVDAAIQPGDSGGALIDADGKVIGIVTAGSVSGSLQQTATQGFAVPIATARSVAEQIVAGHASSTIHIGGTAFLGLQVSGSGTGAPVNGVLVAGTVSGSAAARAGIVAGDIVTEVDGHAVATAEVLRSVLDGHHPGDIVTVRWTDQSGASRTAKVTLADGPTG